MCCVILECSDLSTLILHVHATTLAQALLDGTLSFNHLLGLWRVAASGAIHCPYAEAYKGGNTACCNDGKCCPGCGHTQSPAHSLL